MALRVRIVEGATLAPPRRTDGETEFRFSIFDRNRVPIEGVGPFRPGKQKFELAGFAEGPAQWIDKAYFAGHFFRHFGHFLLESLSRLHSFAPFADHKLLWTGFEAVADWQRATLDLLVPGAEHVFVKRKIECARLVIADHGFEAGGEFHARHAAFLGRHMPGTAFSGERLWLSRSDFPDEGGVEDEPAIETILAGRGWRIVRPERHPLAEQLDMIGGAEIVAGVVGSAFHGVVLLRECRAALRMLARGAAAGPSYRAIAERLGLDQRVIAVPMRHVRGEGSRRRFEMIGEAALHEAIARIDDPPRAGG